MQIDKSIKSILILILGICLFKLPYGGYILSRTLVAVGFGILCYRANKQYGENSNITLNYLVGALIFQPIWKIPFGRTIWCVIDILAILYILYMIFKLRNHEAK